MLLSHLPKSIDKKDLMDFLSKPTSMLSYFLSFNLYFNTLSNTIIMIRRIKLKLTQIELACMATDLTGTDHESI